MAKILLQQVEKKHRLRKTAVISGTIVTAAVVGLTAGAAMAARESGSKEAAGVQIAEDASDQDEDPLSEEPSQPETPSLPAGFMGVIEGVEAAKASNSEYHPIGTNVEEVLVGQRTAKREEVSQFDAGKLIEESVNTIDDQSWELVEKTKISDKDYETLLAIVEAEAGGEDIKGRILVANVIFNRVNSDQFPDTVTEVVWDQSGGSPQFSPTADGRINTVTVSETTREAVNRAIDGEDYSQGALFFIERQYAEDKNVKWFDSNLTFLFQHGVHCFYTY
ncbi:MAG: cell wall hydrolase [Ruminococcus sp.]